MSTGVSLLRCGYIVASYLYILSESYLITSNKALRFVGFKFDFFEVPLTCLGSYGAALMLVCKHGIDMVGTNLAARSAYLLDRYPCDKRCWDKVAVTRRPAHSRLGFTRSHPRSGRWLSNWSIFFSSCSPPSCRHRQTDSRGGVNRGAGDEHGRRLRSAFRRAEPGSTLSGRVSGPCRPGRTVVCGRSGGRHAPTTIGRRLHDKRRVVSG